MIKKLDVLVLILLPVIAALGSLYLRANFLVSTFLFFGLPSLYLSWRTSKAVGILTYFEYFDDSKNTK